MVWKATCDVPHRSILCREEFSDSDGEHGEDIGVTELHPGGLRCHGCTVSKTKAMKRGHWERTDQDPKRWIRAREPTAPMRMCAIWVEEPVRWHHKWYLAENRLRKDASSSASEQGLITLVRSMNIIEEEPLIGARVPLRVCEGAKEGRFVGRGYRDAATDHMGQIVGRDWPAAIDQ